MSGKAGGQHEERSRAGNIGKVRWEKCDVKGGITIGKQKKGEEKCEFGKTNDAGRKDLNGKAGGQHERKEGQHIIEEKSDTGRRNVTGKEVKL